MYGKVRLALTVVAVLALAATGANADFFEDFDSYAVGDLHGQGGWKGWDNTPAAGAPVSDAQAYSGANSVEVIGSADLVHEFDAVGGQWQFSAMQYVPSGGSGVSYFILLNEYNDGGPNRWSVQSKVDYGTGEYVSDYAGASTALVTDQWVEVKCDIDLDANSVSEYYNGELLGTYAWFDAADAEGIAHGAVEAIDLYGNNASPVYYDDISLVVPEPTTVVMLLGLGLGLLVGYLRRKW